METEVKETVIPSWIKEERQFESTILPEIIKESNELSTVIIFVISAVFTITLLFIIAIFIDCRQEKQMRLELQEKQKRRKTFKIRIPKMIAKRVVPEDEQTIADRMEQPSTSNVIV